MTNNFVFKTSCVSFSLVQNKVQWGGVLYLLTNLKLNNFLYEINWIESFYPFFVV